MYLGFCSAPAPSTLPSMSLARFGRTLLYAYVEAILKASTYEGVHERARDGGWGRGWKGTEWGTQADRREGFRAIGSSPAVVVACPVPSALDRATGRGLPPRPITPASMQQASCKRPGWPAHTSVRARTRTRVCVGGGPYVPLPAPRCTPRPGVLPSALRTTSTALSHSALVGPLDPWHAFAPEAPRTQGNTAHMHVTLACR